jgi:hypothetical protein
MFREAEQVTEELARPGSGPTGACFWAPGLGCNCVDHEREREGGGVVDTGWMLRTGIGG